MVPTGKKISLGSPRRLYPMRACGSEKLNSEKGLDDETQLRGKQGILSLFLSLSAPEFIVEPTVGFVYHHRL